MVGLNHLGLGLGVQGAAAAGQPAPPPDIAALVLSGNEIQDNAANGTVIGTLVAAGGTPPFTYSKVSDPSSKLSVVGAELRVAASLSGLTTYGFTVRATDARGKTLDQALTLAISATPVDNGSGITPGDGSVVIPNPADPEFDSAPYVQPPVQQASTSGLKITGRNGGAAQFLKDVGAPVPGAVYTMRYSVDWSLMARLGREAAVGFGFGGNNNFHLAALRGDGVAPTTGMRKSRIYGDFRKANQFTVTDDGAAANGSKDGPNWLRMKIAANGLTYDLSTSANGSAWNAALTGVTLPPFASAGGATQFGPAGYFTQQDKGVFTHTILSWDVQAIPANTAAPSISGTAKVGSTLTAAHGTWTGGNLTYSYQWKADGANISGATGNTYVPVSGDIGKVITVAVTATNEAGSASATSGGTAAVSDSDPYFANVVLLMGFNGVNGATTTSDESSKGHAFAFGGNAQLDTSSKAFGASSLVLDASGDYITTPNSADFRLAPSGNNSDQYTIELWFAPHGNVGGGSWLLGIGTIGEYCWDLDHTQSGGNNSAIAFNWSSNGSSRQSLTASSLAISLDTWHQIVITKNASGKIRMWLDGTLVASATPASSSMAATTQPFEIGRFIGITNTNTRIDEIRITKGVCRYDTDSSITVQSAAFPRS